MATEIYSLAEAREMLTLWKDCERALASGQASKYKIGSREYEAVHLPEIVSRVAYFSNVIDRLTGSARKRRVSRAVPRDL